MDRMAIALERLPRKWAGSMLGCSLLAQAPQPPDQLTKELEALLNIPIQVSGTKASTIFSSPSSVSVVERETLERYGVLSLAEALELVAGVTIQRPLWNRDLPTVRGVMQESYANRCLLLINGVPSWNTLTGDLNLARISIEDVERLEVLRGPASVLYGSSAYAGAINVVLRKNGEGANTRMHAAHYDQGGYGLGATHQSQLGGWSLRVSAQGRHALGRTVDQQADSGPAFTIQDDTHARNATVDLEGHGFTFLANGFREQSPWSGAANSWTTGGGSLWENWGHFLHAAWKFKPTENLSLQGAVTYDASAKNSPIALNHATYGPRSIGLRQRGNRTVGYFSGVWDVNPQVNISLGLTTEKRVNDYYQRFLTSSGETLNENNLKDRTCKEDSLYAQFGWNPGRWNLLLGARQTRNELFGNNLSSRLTAVYQLSDQKAVKFIFGQSFRAPAFLEQYIDFGTVLGTLDLKPETSDSFEVAYLTSSGHLFLQVLAYHSTYKNKAYRAIHSGSIRKYRSAAPFTVNGLEVELKYQNPSVVNAFINVDYIKGDNGDEVAHAIQYGYNYKMVPNWSLTLGLNRSFGDFTAAVLLNGQTSEDGPRGPVDDAGRPWDGVPAWRSLDLTLGYTHTAGGVSIRHTAGLKNALDSERWHPEATRRTINRLPDLQGRLAFYQVALRF